MLWSVAFPAIVGDNLWLWRADHIKLREDEDPNAPNVNKRVHRTRIWEEKDGNQVQVDECLFNNALVVEGNDVTI